MARVAVLGGGITGLSGALALQDAGADVTLFEGGPRFGGSLATVTRDGVIMELGPDSFVRTKPESIQLCERLGVELIGTGEDNARTLIVQKGRLHPIPEGFRLLAPTKWTPFLRSSLISWPGKLRMALDLILPRRPGCSDTDDVSLADFVRRRLGDEALVRLAQPMIAGIFSGDPEELSLRATMPMLLDLEQKHRSLTLGMQAQAKLTKARSAGAAYSLFRTPKDGMQALVDALVQALEPSTLKLDTPVEALVRDGDSWLVRAGEDLSFDRVLVALPNRAAAAVLGVLDPALGAEIAGVPLASAATVNLVWNAEGIEHPLDAFGFVVPANEDRFVMAGTFTQRKYAGRCSPDRVLIRTFVGGALGQDVSANTDEQLVQGSLRDLKDLLGIDAQPVHTEVARYENRQPQYVMGHLDRVARIEAGIDALPALELAGNYLRGVGVAECVRGSAAAAERLLA